MRTPPPNDRIQSPDNHTNIGPLVMLNRIHHREYLKKCCGNFPAQAPHRITSCILYQGDLENCLILLGFIFVYSVVINNNENGTARPCPISLGAQLKCTIM